ncbi:lactase-phlorizin hydrolase-like [Zootermopsis nevadensis]|uniref:lactase-phlorizin hydrolase-like n=1 Tax=Zootermopsis nevadensis TaxID=136037 RepID=UPI000B8E99D6|nr:lactase-phlorizin hydrolase-like [Zootermopsis nevadensis]
MSQSRRMELKFRQQLLTVTLLAGACGVIHAGKEVSSLFKFPREFLFGVSTASYQIEGGWSEDGKGVSIWDTLTHNRPDMVEDGTNGDVASDSYNQYRQDVKALKEMGVDFYRFSISWARILPEGRDNKVNQAGIDYYNNLIDELIANGIEPMITMYHWDLPQALQDLGGWANLLLAEYFEDYARVLFTYFGDRVKVWVTINEPLIVMQGYATSRGFAPAINATGIGDYLAAHTTILAHARAYHLYDEVFRSRQGGKISIALNSNWCEPISDSAEDIAACEQFLQFNIGIFAHPIFSAEGDYPRVVKDRVAQNSRTQGYFKSRLPTFSPEEVEYIRGTSDFFGLNFYTASIGKAGQTGPTPSREGDGGFILTQDPSWPSSGSAWLKVVPWGFRKELNWVVREYNNPPIFVTENGFSDLGGLNDTGRVYFLTSYLKEMLKAIHFDEINVIGYTAWTLLDNFEWNEGYRVKFGLYHVDFNDPNRRRTAKDSAKVYGEITRSRQIPERFRDMKEMTFQSVCLVAFLTVVSGAKRDIDPKILYTFPADFKLGAATASYQIEGAWNEDGKGPNIWDTLTHTRSDLVVDGSTGDKADDSYHRYKEDVKLLKELGAQVYRFSISWARILPEGHDNKVNQPGIDYYNNLIDELLANGIEPMVTMYHWDLPQALQDLGGWPNLLLADYFQDYARVLFTYFGDRVKLWLTFNEPLTFMDGYASDTGMAPSINTPGIGDYLTAHTVIHAHAKAYHVYKNEFREKQGGKIGIALNIHWCEPVSVSVEDVAACEQFQQFNLGIYAHPIFSEEGDYPAVMRERVDRNSVEEGYSTSRLPKFSPEEVEYIKGTHDFMGLNYYTALMGQAGVEGHVPSRYRDTGAITTQDPSWPSSASSWLKVVPWGFRKEFNYIAKEYNNTPIFVTENGFSDLGGLADKDRVYYYTDHLKEMLKAIHEDGVNVIGYTAWSLMDNFEWLRGYSEKFGLYAVDVNDPDLQRVPKDSAKVIAEIYKSRQIPERFRDLESHS